MLRVSKLTDYGTVVMSYLAVHDGRLHCAGDVAAHTGIALPTVAKVLKRLVRGGLLCSVRGQGGGYRLARPAGSISVAQIVSAFEGPMGITECSVGEGLCVQEAVCAIRTGWQRINRAVLSALMDVTLADLVRTLPVAPRARPRQRAARIADAAGARA